MRDVALALSLTLALASCGAAQPAPVREGPAQVGVFEQVEAHAACTSAPTTATLFRELPRGRALVLRVRAPIQEAVRPPRFVAVRYWPIETSTERVYTCDGEVDVAVDAEAIETRFAAERTEAVEHAAAMARGAD